MNRDQLAHVLRAAATITKDADILVIGSQAILGTRDAANLPPDVTMSVESDLAFFDDPDSSKSDLVDGSIGEGSSFHQLHGYYGQGVSVSTATLPDGWGDRLVPFNPQDAEPSNAKCLEAHDLVVSKLVANREKDREFAVALMREDLIDIRVLLDRTTLLDQPEAVKSRVRATIEGCARAAGYG